MKGRIIQNPGRGKVGGFPQWVAVGYGKKFMPLSVLTWEFGLSWCQKHDRDSQFCKVLLE